MWLTVFTMLACILSSLALLLSIVALIKIIAIEKSTHSVQYMPIDEKMQEWATSEKDLENINKEFSENFDMEEDLDVTII